MDAVPRADNVIGCTRALIGVRHMQTFPQERFDAPLINVEASAANYEDRFEMMLDRAPSTLANIKTAAESRPERRQRAHFCRSASLRSRR